MRFAAILALGVGMAFATTARADWLLTNFEDPFQGDLHVAANVDPFSGYALAFRCRRSDKPQIDMMIITPEHVDKSNVPALQAAMVKMLVIVDDEPKIDVVASGGLSANGGDLLTVDSIEPEVFDIARKAAAARRRVAVAVEILGQVVHSHVFDADGSTAAISQISSDCKSAELTENGLNPSAAEASTPAAPGPRVVTYANVTADDWGHLPPTVEVAVYMKAKRLYEAKVHAEKNGSETQSTPHPQN